MGLSPLSALTISILHLQTFVNRTLPKPGAKEMSLIMLCVPTGLQPWRRKLPRIFQRLSSGRLPGLLQCMRRLALCQSDESDYALEMLCVPTGLQPWYQKLSRLHQRAASGRLPGSLLFMQHVMIGQPFVPCLQIPARILTYALCSTGLQPWHRKKLTDDITLFFSVGWLARYNQ